VSPASSKKPAAPLGSPRRSWVGITVVVLVVVLAFASVIALLVGNDDGDDGQDVTAGASTVPTAPPTTVAPSAAGKPCVAQTGTAPAGAPVVPVKVGPPPTALVTEDLTVGTGATVNPGATVTVDYIGVACSTGAIFDSSYSRGQPAPFPLDQVIPGWTQGIPGMKVGGVRLLGIPAELAYGDQPPSGADIAPGETLWFVVTVTNTQ
jgi:peptidylprolyl isomerase